MALGVVEPGLLTTVQDLGRHGCGRWGVPAAGAMDGFALQAANGLVGNPPGAAGLEITLTGPALEVTESCLVAVTGADLGLEVQGRPMPLWTALFVRRGWVLRFAGRRSGCRAYLAVAGGIDVEPVIGSRSTYLRGGFGGLEGRALRAGDLLPVCEPACSLTGRAGLCLPESGRPGYCDKATVEVIPGPQAGAFSDEGLGVFYSSEYGVDPLSDRMGYRLAGPAVAHRGPADIVSDGVVLGSIQVPAGGRPMVMMADRATTGGYTKIATAVSADIPLLAQLVPGIGRVRFRAVTVEAAQARYREMMNGLRRELEAGGLDDWEGRGA